MDISNLLTPLVLDTIGYDERGLLGLALSPSFSNDGTLFFYASYPKIAFLTTLSQLINLQWMELDTLI